jgi:7,8-dihydro-6-hydroxymethylpterin-pyrophosphokinase
MRRASDARGPRVTATLVHLGLGSNLAHPAPASSRGALRSIARLPGTRVVAHSPSYCSAPSAPTTRRPDYVNDVASVARRSARVRFSPRCIGSSAHTGRAPVGTATRRERSTSTFLLYGRRRIRVPGSRPAPAMHQRAFVLRPLADDRPCGDDTRPWPRAHAICAAVRGQRIARTRSHVAR